MADRTAKVKVEWKNTVLEVNTLQYRAGVVMWNMIRWNSKVRSKRKKADNNV